MKTSIFVVEDNEMYYLMLSLKLDGMFNVITHHFESGEDAVENLSLNPDIIVLDYNLTGMNGIETAKQIKKLKPQAKIIFVSSQKDQEVMQKMLDTGAWCYIQKGQGAPERIIASISEIMHN